MSADFPPGPNKDLQYSKGENRRKHSGHLQDARMVFKYGMWIGECPKGFDLAVAADLVQCGIPEFRSTVPEKPYRIWNYYDGAIYVAYSQDGGITWHGFPNGQPQPQPPRLILRQLEQRAKGLGEEARIKQWLKKTWDPKN